MMMTYSYNICGLPIAVQTPRPIWEEGQSTVFSAPDAPPVLTLTLSEAGEISLPEGQPCPSHPECPVWRQGDRISRCSHDLFREKMHLRADYELSCPGRVSALVRGEDWDWATRSKYLWSGAALHALLLHQRGLIFHASYIAHQGGGLLFTAPSGTGKSTQAELWRAHRGAEIINGDKAGVTLREAPMAHGVPFSGTSGICKNRSLPLRAVAVLSQAAENAVTRLSPSQAVAALCANAFVDRAVPEEWSMALNLLLDLAAAVPVYGLACTPDLRAVEALERAMKEDAR